MNDYNELQSRYENLPAQQTYGSLLGWLVNGGLFFLVLTFGVYVFGFFDPLVPKKKLGEVWNLPLHEFLEKTGAPVGWEWTALLHTGDYLSIAAIAFLAAVSMVCYFTLLPNAWAQKNRLLLLMVIAELGLFVLAASNWLAPVSH